MAKVFPEALPSSVRDDPRRRAERRVYEELSTQLGDDWAVYYSVPWIGRSRPDWQREDGEADFVVAHPKQGFATIEVKGGGVERTGGEWYSIDRNRKRHRIKDPFQQAVKSKHVLLESIRRSRGWRKDAWIRSAHFVILPDTSDVRGDLFVHAPRELVVTRDGMTSLGKRVREIMEDAQPNAAPQADGEHLIRTLDDLIGRNIFLRNPLSAQLADEDRELLRLTEAQFDVLHHLKHFRRAAISGCAGSGKTMIAVEKARRAANEGHRTLLTCFNRPLADHLTTITAGIDGLDVSSLLALCVAAARHTDQELPVGDDLDQSVYDNIYPNALSKAMTLDPSLRYETVIVDEGQDMREDWWIAIDDCLVDRERSTLYVFFDDNQRLYDERSVPADLPRFPLNANVRNTRQIVEAIRPLYRGDEPIESRGPAGRSIEAVACTPQTARRELERVITRLIHVEAVNDEDIVVLTLSTVESSSVKGASFPGGRTLGFARPGVKAVRFETVRRFKGLEASLVIIVDVTDRAAADNSDLLYVALSRPRSHLVLLGEKAALERITSREGSLV